MVEEMFISEIPWYNQIQIFNQTLKLMRVDCEDVNRIVTSENIKHCVPVFYQEHATHSESPAIYCVQPPPLGKFDPPLLHVAPKIENLNIFAG